jgi:CheY-like chemotaxis protein
MTGRIVLIEDNEQNRYLVTFLLERSGFAVSSASDGLRGIELVASVMPHIILLDIQLPNLDGYAIARLLRQNREFDGIPIIAVTSFAMAGDREKAISAGCDVYIEKPIDPDTFVETVKSFLDAKAKNP